MILPFDPISLRKQCHGSVEAVDIERDEGNVCG
jgi:hypothetical protein